MAIPNQRGKKMKITFFKNESHFYPYLSYKWENAETVKLNQKIQNFKKYSTWLFMLPCLIFTLLSYRNLNLNYIVLITTIIFCLPIHELCHALLCLISKRKVERICFFPYKKFLTAPAAYVKPSFGVWNKTQTILFSLFPFLLLSIIPAILAIFIPSLRTWLIFLSLLNLSVSHLDIIDIFCFFKIPRNSLNFGDFIITAQEINQPIIIHRLLITPKLDKVEHICFQYTNNKLTEITPPPETPNVLQWKQEFIKQFNLI